MRERAVRIARLDEVCIALVVDAQVRKSAGAEFRSLVLASHMTEEGAKNLWALLEQTAYGGTPPLPRVRRTFIPRGSGAVATINELAGATVKGVRRIRSRVSR